MTITLLQKYLLKLPDAIICATAKFDDASDVWTDEDFKLVEPLSTISRWSRPDEFVNILADVT